jgi:hypothetical protein
MLSTRQYRRRVLLVVVVSAALRVMLCYQGGQYFFGDETRFERAQRLYEAASHGNGREMREVLKWPEHSLFTVLGAVVTAAQRLLAEATPYRDWNLHPENLVFTVRLAACILSLFSALDILLVCKLARVVGADRQEALWATLLMAASNTVFYYSRHLLPYECALCAALAALVAGLGAPSAPRAALCGFLAGAAFHLYNGYWFLPVVVSLVFVLYWRGQPGRARLGCSLGGGLVLGLGLPVLAGTLAGGSFYLRTMLAFSGTAKQGVFAEGWSLPWEYFWYSEGWLGVAVVGCIVFALLRALRERRPLETRILIWLAAIAATYALLVLFSVVLQKFVVYARTLIPLVPLLCVAGGWAIRHLVAERDILRRVVASGLVLCALVQFLPHLTRHFPREIEVQVLREIGNPKHSLSVSGSLYIPLNEPVSRPDLVLVNAQMLYPVREYIGFPQGKILLRAENALTYRPFQYEGHTPREREILRKGDISVCLIQLGSPGEVPDDLPFNLRFQNRDEPSGR